jgi:uncharacterized protein YqeY
VPLLQKIEEDFKVALKHSDKLRISVLRLIKAAIKNKQIEKQADLTDDDVLSILSTLLKQRRESIEQFSKGGRWDLVEKEKQELEIVQSYMPEQLSIEELDSLIKQAISESGVKDSKEIGKVMKILMPKIKGKADGKIVSQRAKELLENK